MEMASNETIKQAVMAGMGVELPVAPHDRAGARERNASRCSTCSGLPVMRDWYVVHLAAKRLSPTAQAFRAFVLKHGQAS